MNTTSAEVMDRDRDIAIATATAPPSATSPLRGVKRTADDSFDDDHRFAKRFNLLNLANGHDKLYIPVTSRPQLQSSLPRPPEDEHMQLDDTKHRVYIHNLDDELADIESDEEKLIFLPDIEKKLNAIPKHILMGEKKDTHQELVLYSLPPSLSVPIEQDNVRKAILEARQRAKEKAINTVALSSGTADGTPPEEQIETAHGYDSPDYGLDEDTNDMDEDGDAMDLS
ncbi:hypothetical protein E4T42_00441 [Aureobasidium subglaciale]|nr:hypothetical protein E4T38_04180 [Aureobasidium subglaciale]KAI5224607.1 hypothetical protein E4T40_04009 [Aureobasidium subglaciale]KAI5227858.1 hypothetical protein E4T41_04229 [Aureobasidium subglaciale]KAI5258820.1 hypothetical protein E4T42_00441 [Aureobasidium subglaciale]KAI5263309.1 hypothetical protein E4T46_03850 [Aureobasidium subglaciale]